MRRGVALAVLAALAACGGETATSVDPGDTAGAPGATSAQSADGRLPDVDLTALSSGEPSSLADIEGPAVINLWATWCAPCRAEIPDFEEVHQARGDEVRFVGVNIGEDAEDAQAFVDDVGATYDQYADADGDVATALSATAMPVTVVIDADGRITTRHLGPLDQDGLNGAIDEAVGITEG